MKKLISFLLILLIFISFNGCESKTIEESNVDYVKLNAWYNLNENSNKVILLENDEVTEYVCKADKSTFKGEKTCIVKPNEELYWDRDKAINKKNGLFKYLGWYDYINITVKSNGKIIGYVVIKVTIETIGMATGGSGQKVFWCTNISPKLIKSVRFDDTSIEKGIKQRYVNRAMKKCKE